jgi:hypothetical protein
LKSKGEGRMRREGKKEEMEMEEKEEAHPLCLAPTFKLS